MKNSKHESEDNKQESKPVPQQTEKQANPFGNLKPAEIPTRLHTFSYQGSTWSNELCDRMVEVLKYMV